MNIKIDQLNSVYSNNMPLSHQKRNKPKAHRNLSYFPERDSSLQASNLHSVIPNEVKKNVSSYLKKIETVY